MKLKRYSKINTNWIYKILYKIQQSDPRDTFSADLEMISGHDFKSMFVQAGVFVQCCVYFRTMHVLVHQ